MTICNLLRNNAGLMALGIVLSLLSTVATLLLPALVNQLLSGVSSGEFREPLVLLLLAILVTSVLRSLFSCWENMVWLVVGRTLSSVSH